MERSDVFPAVRQGPDILVMRDPEYSVNTEICQPGEEGHICVRGECVTHGYEIKGHMTEDPNIKAFTSDGFLCTGDKGFIDSDGHLGAKTTLFFSFSAVISTSFLSYYNVSERSLSETGSGQT
jgi:acyl-CoA synthetase (AMP-forming)/AMP-acid ligase II